MRTNRFNTAAAGDSPQNQQMLDRALLRAAEFGEDEKIRDLIRRGANVNARHTNNDTPLITAAREGHDLTVRHLLKLKAHIRLRNNQGETAEAAARRAGHDAIAVRIRDYRTAPPVQNTPVANATARDINTLSLPRVIRRNKPAP